jgi:hypothetical protein
MIRPLVASRYYQHPFAGAEIARFIDQIERYDQCGDSVCAMYAFFRFLRAFSGSRRISSETCTVPDQTLSDVLHQGRLQILLISFR